MQRLQIHPPARGPAHSAPSVHFFSPQPTHGSRPISRICALAICGVDAGQCARPQMFRGADARGPADHPLSGPDPDYARGY